MINAVWLFLILIGTAVAGLNGRVLEVTNTATLSAGQAVDTMLDILGILVMWTGLSKIAEDSGLMAHLARAIRPVTRFLFPSVPPDHPAMGAMLMNISANFLGLGQAATPLGLRAMQELQKLNQDPATASEAMCTFLALNTSSFTLVPAAVVAVRSAAGSANPAEIVGPTLVATACSAITAVLADFLMRRWGRLRGGGNSPWRR